MRTLVGWACAASIWMFFCVLAPTAAAAAPGQASYIGEQRCITCHQVENRHFGLTTHARAFRENPQSEAEKTVCEACHGPGSLHAIEANNRKREYLIGFTKEWGTPVDVQNGQCLSCHTGQQRIFWPGSTHDSSRLACSDCHNPMARFSARGLLKKAGINETCETCHQQQRAEFNKRSHMPLHEGKMSCEDCHNPHGTNTRPLLKADSINESCYACHAEKRGPFIWEHAPVRENCMNCHLPHGSNQDKLLVGPRPYLCEQCHNGTVGHPGDLFVGSQNATGNVAGGTPAAGTPATAVSGFLVPNMRSIGRSCQNCHSQIHGSNHPSGARFQR